jgi:hypothetical protein
VKESRCNQREKESNMRKKILLMMALIACNLNAKLSYVNKSKDPVTITINYYTREPFIRTLKHKEGWYNIFLGKRSDIVSIQFSAPHTNTLTKTDVSTWTPQQMNAIYKIKTEGGTLRLEEALPSHYPKHLVTKE